MKKIVLIATICIASIVSVKAQEKFTKPKVVSSSFFKYSLRKIEGINSQVTCMLNDKMGSLFLLLQKGFKFDNSLMEDHYNENYMESTKFPKADFKGTVTNISTVNFAKDGVYPVTVEGNLTIHGVTKKITQTGTIEVKAGKVTAKSIFKIKVKDFGIKGEYIGDKIANEVETTVICKFD